MNTLTRRRFLEQSAMSAVSVPILGGLVVGAGAATPVGANGKVRVGLIGSGGMGRGDLDTFLKNPEIRHHVSTVAHLGNIALRSRRKIRGDQEQERVLNDDEADRLVGVRYRGPWESPYYPRS